VCGICGIVRTAGVVAEHELEQMASTLAHRGPDDAGYYTTGHGDRGGACGLGFRRLSIIDVDGGHQPIPNEDESKWVMCNGEIYNFQELRRELEAKGHRFRTRCDSEVIVHLWEEHGPALVERLNGMFALAIWDDATRTLFLARDRLGKKPLYYAALDGSLLFASEPKALLAHPDVLRELDRDGLAMYLAYEYVPAPFSIYRGISKLEAGHTLRWTDGAVDVERYWEPSFDRAEPRSDDEWAAELVDRLRESVRLRLISDVPLGVFLSGGIDSSVVVALMTELMPATDVKTFSIGFREQSFDESRYARRVADHFGTDHHEEILTADAMLDILPEITAFLDEPLADGSIVPTYLLSRFTRSTVTVALGGDGGDELFAGYPTFPAHRAAAFYRVPRRMHAWAERAADRLPVSRRNFSLDFKVKRFLRGATAPPAIRDQLWLGSFSPAEQADLLGEPAADVFAPIHQLSARMRGSDPVDRLIAQYLRFYLEGDILVKVDRASMAASLEVRAPFLDHTFVSFVNSMPPRLKLRRLRSKYILKRAFADRLPPEIANRSKKGFGVPLGDWLRGGLRTTMEELLSESELRAQGIFEPRAVRRLVDDHLSGRRDNRKQLWTLLTFQLWHDAWLRSTSPRPRAEVAQT
jgi:asparagine synthase (glutamine-hydrolysing)